MQRQTLDEVEQAKELLRTLHDLDSNEPKFSLSAHLSLDQIHMERARERLDQVEQNLEIDEQIVDQILDDLVSMTD